MTDIQLTVISSIIIGITVLIGLSAILIKHK
jgi:hypothetical protein